MSAIVIERDGLYLNTKYGLVRWTSLKDATYYKAKVAADLTAKNVRGLAMPASVAERAESERLRELAQLEQGRAA